MDSVRRRELKYQFPQKYLTAFRKDIRHFLAEDSHNKTLPFSRGYKVRSLYFESFDTACFEEKMAGASLRSKFRIRAYLPVRESDSFVLEIKNKENDPVFKQRTEITAQDVADLIAGKHAPVLARHPDNRVVRDFVHEKIYRMFHLSFVVDYHREAFVNSDNLRYIRVNLDTDLRFYSSRHFFENGISGGYYFEGEDAVICEMKFGDSVPFWMPHLVGKYALQAAPFSKFAEGVNRSWNSMPQKFY